LSLKILVCIDGEKHTRWALEWAIRLTVVLQGELTALHVIDSHLKKFSNELYSQGRKEYLEHVDRSLHGEADRARQEITALCEAEGLAFKFKVREGEPMQEILAELRQAPQALVVTGGKEMSAWGRFRSRNLPMQLEKQGNIPILIVRSKSV